MLETLNLDASIKKTEYKSVWNELEIRLGQLQREMRAAEIPTILVLEGWDAAGKGRVLNTMMQAFDPRGFEVYHMAPAAPHELKFPVLRRYWLRLPPNGNISVFDLSWYQEAVTADVNGQFTGYERERAYERIRVFERQLVEGGAVILKFFFHISQEEQSRRLAKFRKNEATAHKSGDAERRRNKRYPDYLDPLETMLRESLTGHAPWTLVPATDRRFATLKVAETIAAAFENALNRSKPAEADSPRAAATRRTSALNGVDLTLTMDRDEYDKKLVPLQDRIQELQYLCFQRRRPLVCVFEGWDAAGKGGAIRRLTKQLDPRGYTVSPIAAPDGLERRHHYLWRFWKALPEAGHWSIYDRSWYGRVLVERVEGFCSVTDWQRAYHEINEFEHQIVESGAPVAKFWVHISPEVQLERLKERQATPHKHRKVTDEDWRNREKWDDYWAAASDMIERTSTTHAPWTIVEANDKLHARIKVLTRVADALTAVLD